MNDILIIEDEKAIASLIGMLLERSGYSVEIASDGLEGVSKFDQGIFGLVITDICMPGLDGQAVARHIRNSKTKFAPVIGMSGTPWLLDNNHFDAVIAKPFSIQALLDAVETYYVPSPVRLAS